jgi:hypothetical protein
MNMKAMSDKAFYERTVDHLQLHAPTQVGSFREYAEDRGIVNPITNYLDLASFKRTNRNFKNTVPLSYERDHDAGECRGIKSFPSYGLGQSIANDVVFAPFSRYSRY